MSCWESMAVRSLRLVTFSQCLLFITGLLYMSSMAGRQVMLPVHCREECHDICISDTTLSCWELMAVRSLRPVTFSLHSLFITELLFTSSMAGRQVILPLHCRDTCYDICISDTTLWPASAYSLYQPYLKKFICSH